jgi:hypothetical protein
VQHAGRRLVWWYCVGFRRVATDGIRREHRGRQETGPGCTDQDSDETTVPRARTRQPSRSGDEQRAGDNEVRRLYEAAGTKGQGAHRLSQWTVVTPLRTLHDEDAHEERAGDDSASE